MLSPLDDFFYRFMFSPVFEILMSPTNPSILMIVVKNPSGSLYCDPNLCLLCISSATVVGIVLPCPDPNTGDPVEWLYVSFGTPLAVLIESLTYLNKSLRSAVSLAGI